MAAPYPPSGSGEGPPLTADQRLVIELEQQFPDYQAWTVPTWNGSQHGVIWCARRWDGTGTTINADTPAVLAEYMAAAEAQADN